ncbi:hypothetical protein GA0074692_5848 [Micromonospora pallida]|uniref:Excreted virulence factor EspC, type VII ESX diderm n=1 Tax=Micromonospora pallida TaxID=145854 RepID=A0A1C6TFL1_9ACTN|nr:hypothetical protein [Micromonospora pallida]SCL40534.1 hypothetical protein GA0074692_5848 [Micromonospora pallida]
MSTDSSWGDYLSTDTSLPDVGVAAYDPVTVDAATVEPVLPEPVLDVVETEVAGAVADQDWSDWHAASGDQWADSAQDWVDYANENLAAGNYEVADSAFAHAANHADIADGNYDVSLDYSTQAATHLDTAVAEVAPYDTYGAGTSFDLAE